MLTDILAFPGNRAVFDDLVDLLKERLSVAFVGAGASAGLYPTWSRLIELLADHAVDRGRAEREDAERWKTDTTSTPQQRVDIIARELGNPRYHDFLADTFGPKRGADGKRYTALHGTLLRLPFRGYVTTNYDPGLDFARQELRPDSLSAGTPTWQDGNTVHRWRTGDIFRRDDCPMLWLHGCWLRPDGIVLNSGSYSEAYKQGIYRETFKDLWIREHLLFTGFSFSDPQFTFMVSEFRRDIADVDPVPRHIALLGWPLPDDGATPGRKEVGEKRETLEADYQVRALFCPVRNGDHSSLGALLDGLADACGRGAVTQAAVAADKACSGSVAALTPLPARWVHETTNDDKFRGRQEEFERLDRWVRDETTRVVAVCAVGGTGKTALVGHWLKETDQWRRRGTPFAGVFGWSFYQNRSTDEFLLSLLQWATESLLLAGPPPSERAELLPAVSRLLRDQALALVLDGLEVLQEGLETERYGAFLDAGLRELLHELCEDEESHSLAVLTSRFVFADLVRHLGTVFHQLELPGLPSDQGARLLSDLGVHGPAIDREEVSRRLDGHPLALRVFAASLPYEDRAQPLRFLDHAFTPDAVPPGAPMSDKLRRLLVFYDKQLPPDHVRLLSIVALFRSPVTEETVARLMRGVFETRMAPSFPAEDATSHVLATLHTGGILSLEPVEGAYGYACHPILRDHFRAVLLGTGAETARRTADLLSGKPSEERPRTVKEIEPVLSAIELLLDAGDFKGADDLYRGRLGDGLVFRCIPAIADGLASALNFVRDEKRRRQCEESLSRWRLGFYLNEVGLYAGNCGQYALALGYLGEGISIARAMNDAPNLSIGLGNKVEFLVCLGRLAEAYQTATEALALAEADRDVWELLRTRAHRSWVHGMRGQVRRAAGDFACANAFNKKEDPDGYELYSLAGNQWAEFLLRSGHSAPASRRTTTNLSICKGNEWNDDAAHCHSMLAECALAEGRLDEAASALEVAEPVFHRGQLLFELARLHVTAGRLALARKDTPAAFRRVAEALALAQPRGMKLVHADALILRGRARLLEARPDCAVRALDDAEDALRIARECDYAWAVRDALFLEADAGASLARDHGQVDPARAARERAASERARAEAGALAAKLTLTEEDLAQADREAVTWLAEWEREFRRAGTS
jgi:tetratricopeptide (TPR) repeat protein